MSGRELLPLKVVDVDHENAVVGIEDGHGLRLELVDVSKVSAGRISGRGLVLFSFDAGGAEYGFFLPVADVQRLAAALTEGAADAARLEAEAGTAGSA